MSAVLRQKGRIPSQRGVMTPIFTEGGALLEFRAVKQTIHPNRELILDHHPVDIDRTAVASVAAETGLDSAAVFERSGVKAGVNNSGRVAEAEEDRVGSA